jgi:hypothetical protein
MSTNGDQRESSPPPPRSGGLVVFKAFVALAVIVVFIFLFRSKNSSPGNLPAPQGNTVENNSNLPPGGFQNTPSALSNNSLGNTQALADLASRAASPNPASGSGPGTNEEANLPALTVLDKARVVMHNYRAAFGENPVGTNPEITAALMGKNPKQINFVADSGLRVNEKGEMIDAYGTPFFFHQISGQEMEIRSAGADHIMWTGDDLVTR